MEQNSENKFILNQLEQCFEEHKHLFSKQGKQTFIHEYGHMKVALNTEFNFTVIIIKECLFKPNHLFFYQNNSIRYSSFNHVFSFSHAKGYALFYSPKHLSQVNNQLKSEDAILWKEIAIGGLKEEVMYGDHHFYNILQGFGLSSLALLIFFSILGLITVFIFPFLPRHLYALAIGLIWVGTALYSLRFLFKKMVNNCFKKKTIVSKSDYKLLKTLKSDPYYYKNFNDYAYSVHQYLYNQSSVQPDSKWPLKKIKNMIKKETDSTTTN